VVATGGLDAFPAAETVAYDVAAGGETLSGQLGDLGFAETFNHL
jgi:hypothetical protein